MGQKSRFACLPSRMQHTSPCKEWCIWRVPCRSSTEPSAAASVFLRLSNVPICLWRWVWASSSTSSCRSWNRSFLIPCPKWFWRTGCFQPRRASDGGNQAGGWYGGSSIWETWELRGGETRWRLDPWATPSSGSGLPYQWTSWKGRCLLPSSSSLLFLGVCLNHVGIPLWVGKPATLPSH